MYMMCLFFSVFPSRSVPRLICLFKNHILVIFGGKNVFIYEIKMSEMSGFFFRKLYWYHYAYWILIYIRHHIRVTSTLSLPLVILMGSEITPKSLSIIYGPYSIFIPVWFGNCSFGTPETLSLVPITIITIRFALHRSISSPVSLSYSNKFKMYLLNIYIILIYKLNLKFNVGVQYSNLQCWRN